MINQTWSLAISLFGLANQIDATQNEQKSPFTVHKPTFKPNYKWMTPHVMTAKPRNYWQYVAEDRIKSPFEYGGAKPGESTKGREPVNAITYGSSYHGIPGHREVEYGQWAKTLRLDASSFYDVVMRDDDHLWVVTFMDPKCKHCSRFVPQWVKLKQYEHLQKRNVKFAYVDITIPENMQRIARRYLPEGKQNKKIPTPSVYIFGRDKQNPVKYVGSKFSYKVNEYLEGYCDLNAYDEKIKDKQSYLSKIPKVVEPQQIAYQPPDAPIKKEAVKQNRYPIITSRNKAIQNLPGYNPNEYYEHTPTLGDVVSEINQYGMYDKSISLRGVWAQSQALDHTNFAQTVVNDKDHAWAVTFMNPNCPKCRKLAKEWERLQHFKTIEGHKIRFAHVDVSDPQVQNIILQKFTGGMTSMYTPTILFYGSNKSRPFEYRGVPDANRLSVFIKNFCNSEGFGKQSAVQGAQTQLANSRSQYPSGNRINYGIWSRTKRLNLHTFQEQVMRDDKNVWIVSFINPNCPACAKFAPYWDKTQTYNSLRTRNVKFAFVNLYGTEGEDEIKKRFTGGYNMWQTPVVLIYGRDKTKPILYSGVHDSNTLSAYIARYCDKNGYHRGAFVQTHHSRPQIKRQLPRPPVKRQYPTLSRQDATRYHQSSSILNNPANRSYASPYQRGSAYRRNTAAPQRRGGSRYRGGYQSQFGGQYGQDGSRNSGKTGYGASDFGARPTANSRSSYDYDNASGSSLHKAGFRGHNRPSSGYLGFKPSTNSRTSFYSRPNRRSSSSSPYRGRSSSSYSSRPTSRYG